MFEPVIGTLKWLVDHLLKSLGLAQAQTREHDIALFREGDALLNEPMLKTLLNGDLYNWWCRSNDITILGHFCSDFRLESKQFLDRPVRKAALDAVSALDVVSRFVSSNFYSDDSVKLHLQPELRRANDITKREQYQAYVVELNALIDAAWGAYVRYRVVVRDRLKV